MIGKKISHYNILKKIGEGGHVLRSRKILEKTGEGGTVLRSRTNIKYGRRNL